MLPVCPVAATLRMALAVGVCAAATAQQHPAPPKRGAAAAHGQHDQQGPSAWEAEFAASSIFRSGTYIQPLWRGLGFEGHYFGAGQTDVGHTGVSWTFKLGELKLVPGFGVTFGSNQFATTPAVTFRWDYARRWFVTQGMAIQGIRKTPVFEEHEDEPHGQASQEPAGYVRPTISDGSHVSVRWKRVTIGGTWEHIQFREGNEWKGGGRLAVRIFPRISALLYVLGPGKAEWRGGILIHPPEDD